MKNLFYSAYEAEEVLIAVAITGIVALSLTLFAFQTKIDFTMLNGILFVLLICLLCFGFFAMIFRNNVKFIILLSRNDQFPIAAVLDFRLLE